MAILKWIGHQRVDSFSSKHGPVAHVNVLQKDKKQFYFFFISALQAPQWATASSFTRFLDHTRLTTVGTTPVDE